MFVIIFLSFRSCPLSIDIFTFSAFSWLVGIPGWELRVVGPGQRCHHYISGSVNIVNCSPPTRIVRSRVVCLFDVV